MDDSSSPPATGQASSSYGGRDLIGYAGQGMPGTWPGGAVVAINFVINYEEGGESCLLHGDKQSEHLLSEIVGASPYGKICDLLSGTRKEMGGWNSSSIVCHHLVLIVF